MARAQASTISGYGSSSTLLMLCIVVAVMYFVVFTCVHCRKKPRPSQNVMYYGGGSVPSYAGPYGGGAGRSKFGGAGVGLATGVAVDAAFSGCGGCGGGGGCGSGCCDGGD